MAAARPLVTVFDAAGVPVEGASLPLPGVFTAPIRRDIVQFVHTNMAMNKRQAYAVKYEAGMQHSAESWGTGRAVARIPRVSGSGTHRAGQAAFGNMCRSGRMFAPTKIWRKWHRKINVNQRRYATVSALAATAIPAIVMARGHTIDDVEEVPLVVRGLSGITKTKAASAALARVGALADVAKVKDSRQVRAGKGKMRNRRFVQRRGPLVVVADEDTKAVERAFRNLPGIEVTNVTRLNLLQLAPGGHLGRFCVWTEAAFKALDGVFGTATTESTQKSGYKLPKGLLTNADLGRIINSTEVQSVLRKTVKVTKSKQHKNALKNFGRMVQLNPHTVAVRRAELLGKANKKRKELSKEQTKARRAAGKAFFTALKADTYTAGAYGTEQ